MTDNVQTLEGALPKNPSVGNSPTPGSLYAQARGSVLPRIISLGGGVQSTALMLMSCLGEVERADCAIFADTGDESEATYRHLDWLKSEAAKFDLPIYVVSKGVLSEALLHDGFSRIPSFGSRGGLSPRQCTGDYKQKVIRKHIRRLYGLTPSEVWIGISLDEVHRMKPADVRWLTHRWPLIEKRLTRHDCLMWMEKRGFPKPPRSACVFCPFHSDHEWRMLKKGGGRDWEKAVAVSSALAKVGQYLHRKLKPIDEVDINTGLDKAQMELWGNECGGNCGV